MFLFDLFADFARPFRDARSEIEDGDDEMDIPMSLSDDASNASLSDPLTANSDLSISLSSLSLMQSPPSTQTPSAGPSFQDLHTSGPLHGNYPYWTTPNSRRRGVRSSARHSVYSLPSREERQAFKSLPRPKKDMFVEGNHLHSVLPVEPTVISPTADIVLAHNRTDIGVNPVEIHLSSQFAAQCRDMENQHTPDSILTPTSTSQEPPCTIGTNSLTIKIPGLVDRLALRLLSSCNVMGQTEEDEDGFSSPDASTASESSDGDMDDDEVGDGDYNTSAVAARVPDRSSRRKLRRSAAAPYFRAGGKAKRKELWVDRDTGVGTLLLMSPTTEHPRRS
ncbi:hypothetical protein F5148DRAFT_219180 [Russula earlei]|uniref:Uncharacterized protein n=1 Tax=Russula earlei TaxID=71964 RepID=A0ACC0U4R1_9AGAM|nr:hypothetical protein F5148DRAFT_219180 [Russula earlei]